MASINGLFYPHSSRLHGKIKYSLFDSIVRFTIWWRPSPPMFTASYYSRYQVGCLKVLNSYWITGNSIRFHSQTNMLNYFINAISIVGVPNRSGPLAYSTNTAHNLDLFTQSHITIDRQKLCIRSFKHLLTSIKLKRNLGNHDGISAIIDSRKNPINSEKQYVIETPQRE